MIKFEKVKRFEQEEVEMPTRGTASSAGYDFYVAEDIVVPPYKYLMEDLEELDDTDVASFSLDEVALMTKVYGDKPTLVSTGVKCYLDKEYYLELSVRSSTPLKYWLILANGVGIIDSDYAGNPANDGEIFFQLINLSPFPIRLHKGDKIGQGIIKRYYVTDDDAANAARVGGFGSTDE